MLRAPLTLPSCFCWSGVASSLDPVSEVLAILPLRIHRDIAPTPPSPFQTTQALRHGHDTSESGTQHHSVRDGNTACVHLPTPLFLV